MSQPILRADFIRQFLQMQKDLEVLKYKVSGGLYIDRGPDTGDNGRPTPEPYNKNLIWVVDQGTTKQITISTGATWEAIAPPTT